jgi:hypothetical protein
MHEDSKTLPPPPLKSSHSSDKAHIFIAEVTLQEKIYCKLPLVTVTDNLDQLILNRKSLIQSGHFSFVPNVDN